MARMASSLMGSGSMGSRGVDPDVLAFDMRTVTYMAHENLHV
jgi:hypothetical protein